MNNNKTVLIKLKILSIETALSAYRCSKCRQASMLTIEKLISTQLKTNGQETENWDGWRDGVVLKQRIGPYKRGPLVVQIFKELDYSVGYLLDWRSLFVHHCDRVCYAVPNAVFGVEIAVRVKILRFVHPVFPEPLNTTEDSMLSSKPSLFSSQSFIVAAMCFSLLLWKKMHDVSSLTSFLALLPHLYLL